LIAPTIARPTGGAERRKNDNKRARRQEQKKNFFFEKKKQKTFGTKWRMSQCACDPLVPGDRWRTGGISTKGQSFFWFFFVHKKEHLLFSIILN